MTAETVSTEPSEPSSEPVRSGQSVLLVLGAIIVLPLLLVIVVLLLRGSGSSVADEVREDRIQAVYMTSDLVYFGQVRAGSGDFLRVENAFFLRRTSGEAADGKNAADDDGGGDTELVPVSQEVGGEDDMLVNTGEVFRIQDLSPDSEIASTIEDAIK
jgi:hypothetical protein